MALAALVHSAAFRLAIAIVPQLAGGRDGDPEAPVKEHQPQGLLPPPESTVSGGDGGGAE
jgi:hypothetical protein